MFAQDYASPGAVPVQQQTVQKWTRAHSNNVWSRKFEI